MSKKIRLGVNIDHVATLRNARGGKNPDILQAAKLAMQGGANFITVHLREDRRHINDDDLYSLVTNDIPLNLEIAPVQEMLDIAKKYKLYSICFVPEKRQEVTTESGLDVIKNKQLLSDYVKQLQKNVKIISLFIDPDIEQLKSSVVTGASAVELHLGNYQQIVDEGSQKLITKELEKINNVVEYGAGMIKIHAGHGLDIFNVGPIAAITDIEELNIGHAIISEAISSGLFYSVKTMVDKINQVRV